MLGGYGDTSYRPFEDEELGQLESLIGMQQPSMGAPEPGMQPAPTMMPEPQSPPEPVGAPQQSMPLIGAPSAVQPEPFQPPAPAAPLDMGLPAAPKPPPGLVRSGYAVDGVPNAERDKLVGLHQQLAEQKMASIDSGAQAEAGIANSGIQRADKRIGAANVEANKAQMALAGQQSARQKLEAEGAEWSKLKEDPSKAFEGIEWAGVLAAIGIGAGTFAQAMGWQKGNPVLEAFDTHVNRSIAAQREQKNSRLQFIKERIGDHQAAESILSAQLHDAIADRAEGEMARATSEDALKRLGSLVEAERAKVQEGVVAAYERMVPREQQQFARPTPGPAGKGLLEELSELTDLDKKLEERGWNLENPIRAEIQRRISTIQLGPGGAPPPVPDQRGDTAPKYDQKKAQFQGQEDTQAALAGIERVAKLGGLVDDGSGLYKRDPKYEGALGLRDWGAGEMAPGLQRAFGADTPVIDQFDATVPLVAKALGVNAAEARRLMGADTASREELASKFNAIKEQLRNRAVPGQRDPKTLESAGFRRTGP